MEKKDCTRREFFRTIGLGAFAVQVGNIENTHPIGDYDVLGTFNGAVEEVVLNLDGRELTDHEYDDKLCKP